MMHLICPQYNQEPVLSKEDHAVMKPVCDYQASHLSNGLPYNKNKSACRKIPANSSTTQKKNLIIHAC